MSRKPRRSLTTLLQESLATKIRRRGEDYFRWGAVRHLKGDPFFVMARVQGTQLYDTAIHYHYDQDDQAVSASCSCPYFTDNGLCKHIWAVLLAAEKKGLLSAAVDDQCDRFVDFDPDEGGDPFKGEHKNPGPGSFPPSRISQGQRRPDRPSREGQAWKRHFEALEQQFRSRQAHERAMPVSWPSNRHIHYIIDAAETLHRPGLVVEIACRDRKKDGELGKVRFPSIRSAQIDLMPDLQDRRLLAALTGAANPTYSGYSDRHYYEGDMDRLLPLKFVLSRQLSLELVPLLCATGRCAIRREPNENSELIPIAWDDGRAWEFGLDVVLSPDGLYYTLTGLLRRGEQSRLVSEPLLLTAGGLVFTTETAGRLEFHEAFDWIVHLRQHGPVLVPQQEGGLMLERLLTLPQQPPLRLPPELQVEQVRVRPSPGLKVQDKSRQRYSYRPRLTAHYAFDYDGVKVLAADPRPGIFQIAQRRLLLRDHEAEERAAARLRQLGFREPTYWNRLEGDQLELPPKKLPGVVAQLLAEGWQVEAEGKLYRRPGQMNIGVSSGIDWFELHAEVAFDDQKIPLPRLLQALRRGDSLVELGDGTFGLLPEEWLKKYAPLVSLGDVHDEHLRFRPAQIGFLDALLAAMPEARCDEVFARARRQLQQFAGIRPADPPEQFTGELRPYQRDGLGWLHFLRQFRFGGCLADDMGLGKTVQVLAKLQARRQEKAENNGDLPRPSLVVVPRSLVFNWKQEAARFTPDLLLLDHSGVERLGQKGRQSLDHFADYDLVLTTYGTLRRDVAQLKEVRFDFAILDEAQVIKNPATASAKAARLLQARHRLVLTGTPVENHLGDLWSLFEFLNPGLLGSASVFKMIGAGAKQVSPETRELLGRALRPFILRRTKEQAARDLPPKLEQTLYCDLEPPQRKLYDELRDHYRRTLLARVSERGLNRSKIQVLEALLRLRQAACHPGLIDPARRPEPSAKLDALLPQLEQVMDEGHKALIFSQFTSLLSIVRGRLDAKALGYEYLDGRTRDRAVRVRRFQSEPDCRLFLISLKAGGLGLNLTAAEYVFLLDPWWNPAVEAQAIDRAHRIGQERRVFAYRLIAKDTVEEKVLELQATKRDLAEAIINADNRLIRDLGREDLELLLS